jgi:hypothetical protein
LPQRGKKQKKNYFNFVIRKKNAEARIKKTLSKVMQKKPKRNAYKKEPCNKYGLKKEKKVFYLYDPYSEPNYNPGGGPMPQQQQGFQIPQINMPNFEMPSMQGPKIDFKKILPIIAVLIVLIIIGFAALTWLGSQKNVTIKILDSTGETVEARLILKDASGNKITLTPRTGPASTYKATLVTGTTYTATITADGYKAVTNKTIEYTGEEKLDLNVTKDIQASISMEDLGFNEIFDGQTIPGKLKIDNTGNNKIPISEIQDQTTLPLQAVINAGDTTEILPGGSIFLDFNVKIKAGQKITEQKKAIISFNIAGSSIESNAKELQVLPAVQETEVTITPTTGSFSKTDLTAGSQTTIKIKVANNNAKYPLKNVLLTVKPNPGYEKYLSWFEFSQSVEGKKYSKLIDSIDPKKFEETTLYLTTPITTEAQTEFKGYLLVESYSIKGTKNPDLLYRVSTAKKVEVGITGTPINLPITVNCSKRDQTCETKRYSNGEVYMKNNGNTNIGEITIDLDLQQSDATCQQYLLKYATLNSANTKVIPKLDASEKATILIDITAPVEAPNKSSTRCILKWKYKDPLSASGDYIDPIPYLPIEINKLES